MYTDIEFRAVLIADCGMERTRVTLVDVVGENVYRMVGQQELPSTAEPPFGDVTIGLREAIAALEQSTGRQLLENGRLRIPQSRDGQGFDALVATCSAGGGLPILVVAVTADITAQSAVRAIEGTYAVPFRVVTMEEILRDNPLKGVEKDRSGELWWQLLQHLPPGGVLMVGGIDGGNVAPLHTLARALIEALPPLPTRIEQEVTSRPLPVIYAGNERAQEVIETQLPDRVDLRTTDNVRPRLRQEEIQPARQEVTRLYEEQVLRQIPGYEELSSWTEGPVQLPYKGVQLVTRFLAVHHQRRVLSLDLGSGATTAVWADEEQSVRVVLGHLGVGYGTGRVLARRGVERIAQWLPFPISEERVRDWVLNRSLRPRTIPVTSRELLLQQAVAREALAGAVERLRQQIPLEFELVVATGGGLARVPQWHQLVQILLDVLEPTGENLTGLVDLYADRSCLLPSIGALATVNPDAASCLLLQDGLFHLGPCLIPLGRGRIGSKALSLVLEFEGEMRHNVDVRWGDLVAIPFHWRKTAHLTVNPARRARVGLGRPGERLTTKEGEPIDGGALGLIVDARGRPLELPGEAEERQALLRRWMEQLGSYSTEELQELVLKPELAEPEEVEVEVEEAAG